MAKNKIKTRKAAKKRFKLTGTGKLKRYKSGLRHILNNKNSKRKRNKQGTFDVDASDVARVKRMLPGI